MSDEVIDNENEESVDSSMDSMAAGYDAIESSESESGSAVPIQAEPVPGVVPDAVVEPLDIPKHWSQDAQSQFGKLERTAQEAWLAHDKERERGFHKFSESVKPYKEFHQKWGEFYRERGVDPSRVMDEWAEVDRLMGQGNNAQKIQMLGKIAEVYGVDLSEGGLTQSRPSLTLCLIPN